MRRFALAMIVALLTVSASGLASLVITEPCTTTDPGGHDDGVCPPTCVTCGCCAQAAEPASLTLTSAPLERVTNIALFLPPLPRTIPRDILHVPKLRLA